MTKQVLLVNVIGVDALVLKAPGLLAPALERVLNDGQNMVDLLIQDDVRSPQGEDAAGRGLVRGAEAEGGGWERRGAGNGTAYPPM